METRQNVFHKIENFELVQTVLESCGKQAASEKSFEIKPPVQLHHTANKLLYNIQESFLFCFGCHTV